MVKKRKILITILIALLIVIGAVAVWQFDNIKAGWLAMRYSPEELAGQIDDSDKVYDDILRKQPNLNLSELSPEDQQRLASGEMTADEAVLKMTGGSATAQSASGGQAEDPEKLALAQKEQRIAELIARTKALRGVFKGRLAGMKSSVISEYKALPESERTPAAKRELISRAISAASAAESQCDGEIIAIIGELTTLLKETGGDVSIASDIKAAYAHEKAATKAYYMSMQK